MLALRPSPCSRLLYTILPAPYTQGTLNDLLRSWVEDLNKLAEDGITVVGQQNDTYLFKRSYFQGSIVC